jgi:restriction system protein
VDFKAAARKVLSEVGHPLHHTDITEIALESGYLESAGRTPQNTMRARLSVDVTDNPDTPFAQTAPSSRPLPASTASKERVSGLRDAILRGIILTNAEERLWSS